MQKLAPSQAASCISGSGTGGQITSGLFIPVAQLGNLRFVPTANLNGDGAASINFKVQNANGFDATDRTAMTFDITPVNDGDRYFRSADGAWPVKH